MARRPSPILDIVAELPSTTDDVEKLRLLRNKLNRNYQGFEDRRDFLVALFYKGLVGEVITQIERNATGSSLSRLEAHHDLVAALIESLRIAPSFSESTQSLFHWFHQIHRFAEKYRDFSPSAPSEEHIIDDNITTVADAEFIAIGHELIESRARKTAMLEVDQVPFDVFLRLDGIAPHDAARRTVRWYKDAVKQQRAIGRDNTTLCFIESGPSISQYAPSGGLSLLPALFDPTSNSPLVYRSATEEAGPQLDFKEPVNVSKVLLVDDAVRSGRTIAEATDFLRHEHGIDVDAAIVLVDFEEGSTETLRELNVTFVPRFKWSRIAPAFIGAFSETRSNPNGVKPKVVDIKAITRQNRATMYGEQEFIPDTAAVSGRNDDEIEQTSISSLAKYHHSLTPNPERLQERRRQNEAILRAMGERSLAKYHHSLTPNPERLQERRRQNEAILRAMRRRIAVDR